MRDYYHFGHTHDPSTPTVATLQETIQQGRRERTTLQTEHLLQQAKLVKLDQQCSRLLVWGGKVASGALMTTGAPGVVPLTSLSAPGTMDWRLAQLQREACALQAVFDNVAGARAAAEAKCARAKQRADSAAEVVAQLTVTLDKACGRLQWKAGDLEAGEGVVKAKGAPGAGARGSAAGVPAAATEGFDAARQRRMDAYEEEFRRLRVEIADFTARLEQQAAATAVAVRTAEAYVGTLESKVARKQARLVAVQGERQAWADKLVALASSDWRSELRTEIDTAHRTLLMRARSVAKQ